MLLRCCDREGLTMMSDRAGGRLVGLVDRVVGVFRRLVGRIFGGPQSTGGDHDAGESESSQCGVEQVSFCAHNGTFRAVRVHDLVQSWAPG